MKVIIPAGIGLVISIIGAIYGRQRKDVAAWMKARRIDMKPGKDGQRCGVCGKPMQLKRIHTGNRAGVYWACTSWPECRKIERIE